MVEFDSRHNPVDVLFMCAVDIWGEEHLDNLNWIEWNNYMEADDGTD